MIAASAPAKLILVGEHAVVYGYPALAVPLPDIRARVIIHPLAVGEGVQFVADDIGRSWIMANNPDEPLSLLATETLAYLGTPAPDIRAVISSAIPVASGMGSGAAVAVALVGALARLAGRTLAAAEISTLVFASEQRYHGSPSGIDNTVIAFAQPLHFQRIDGVPTMRPLKIGRTFTLVIGDTGVRSATRLPVTDVRRRHAADPTRYAAIFAALGTQTDAAQHALASGDLAALGQSFDSSHDLLGDLGVSSLDLDRLVFTARAAGAHGAKLSGAGWGGVMIALVDDQTRAPVEQALHKAGAARVLTTVVERND